LIASDWVFIRLLRERKREKEKKEKKEGEKGRKKGIFFSLVKRREWFCLMSRMCNAKTRFYLFVTYTENKKGFMRN
jgi:hypothetical protein